MNLEQHLLSRHCDVQFYRPALDEQEGTATFLLWNLSGQLTGYQVYRPNANKEKKNDPREGRYYTYRAPEGDLEGPKQARNKLAFFGTETLNRPGPLFLTEGLFDAVRLHNRGFAALALLSNDPKQFRAALTALGRRLIAICDNDAAGRKLAKIGDSHYVCTGHDLGDMTETQITQMMEKIFNAS